MFNALGACALLLQIFPDGRPLPRPRNLATAIRRAHGPELLAALEIPDCRCPISQPCPHVTWTDHHYSLQEWLELMREILPEAEYRADYVTPLPATATWRLPGPYKVWDLAERADECRALWHPDDADSDQSERLDEVLLKGGNARQLKRGGFVRNEVLAPPRKPKQGKLLDVKACKRALLKFRLERYLERKRSSESHSSPESHSEEPTCSATNKS